MLKLSLLLLAIALPVPGQEKEKPLPDRTQFLIEFQVKRQGIYKLMGNSDNATLLSQYTYRDSASEISLDAKGNPKETRKQVYERIPTRLIGYIYERQIVKDGVPLTAQELEKQDRKNEENVTKSEAERKKQYDTFIAQRAERRKQLEKTLNKEFDKQGLKGEERKKAMEAGLKKFDDAEANGGRAPDAPRKMEESSVLQAIDMQLVRRETLDDRAVILLTFKPKAGYKGGGNVVEKMLQHLEGRIWVSEDDYQMMKIDATVTSPLSIGFGVLAKVMPGTHALFEYRKFNNEVWLPSRQEFTINGRLLFVKGMHMREVHEYSDYKKYVVSTQIHAVEGQ